MIFSDEKDIVWNVNIKAYDCAIPVEINNSSVFKLMKFKIILN